MGVVDRLSHTEQLCEQEPPGGGRVFVEVGLGHERCH